LKKLTFLLICSCILILFTGCKGADSNAANSGKTAKQFTILTLDRIKSTDFLKHAIPTFEQLYNCKVTVISCAGSSELMELIKNPKNAKKYDLILGIDNCFITDVADYDAFAETTVLQKHPINANYVFDKKNRVIPYGYGYLAMLYNETKITEPPESFGQLQDARYLNQIAVVNPRSSGIGRAVMYWTIALFGNDGYQQFWKSIKKNVFASKDSWQEAVAALNNQECSMAFGFTSTPAWVLETQPNPLPIKASLMKEGSFLYIEAAAIPKKAKQKSMAEAFLAYLLSPGIQRYVPLDLGIFPSNESAPLPVNFAAIPFTSFSVNDKLKQENPATNLSSWLDFWDKLFSHSIL
jgi:thiamine transport system substrate-binding protein